MSLSVLAGQHAPGVVLEVFQPHTPSSLARHLIDGTFKTCLRPQKVYLSQITDRSVSAYMLIYTDVIFFFPNIMLIAFLYVSFNLI